MKKPSLPRHSASSEARHAHRNSDGATRKNLRSSRAHAARSNNRTRHNFSSSHSSSGRSNSQKEPLLLSRRKFLYGAIGVGAVAAIGGGTLAVKAIDNSDSGEVDYLEVPQSALTTQFDFEAIEDYESKVTLLASFDIPYGTLVWVNDDSVAACLLPTESGSPLAQIGLLYLGSGHLDTARENAVGKSEGYEIYDVRATSNGLIWTEANIMQGAWRIYTATLDNSVMGQPILVDEGTSEYETPTLAAVNTKAFWQKIPNSTKDLENYSKLMCAKFGESKTTCLYESKRRNSTPVYADNSSVVITPRLDTSSIFHQLTRIDASTEKITDTMVLPQSMKPLEAGYGKTGFMFSFPDIYNYGEGISNLGTYVPFNLPNDGNYSNVSWFGFARTPSAAPCWAGDSLVIKSTYSVCGIDLNKSTYYAIDVENGADSFGEYLASAGTRDTFVTYTNIDHTPVGGDHIHVCRVKIWKPL